MGADEKLSCDEVPGKFTEWLLFMGCPADRLPSQDKVAQICRGQYYVVWRSLIEKVDDRNVVRHKRLQVFCDDVKRCQTRHLLSKNAARALMPEQLALQKQQTELKSNVNETKKRIDILRADLKHNMDKISIKVAEHSISRLRCDDAARRVWLLRQVASKLQAKSDNLAETKTIAHFLCAGDLNGDLQGNLDRCLTSLRRQSIQPSLSLDSNSSSISVTPENELEDQIYQLVRGRGDMLIPELLAKREDLVKALAGPDKNNSQTRNKESLQSALAHSRALQCTLGLGAAKNKIHLKQTRAKLLATVSELNNYLSNESCELLVLRCEKAAVSARVEAYRAILEDLTTNSGVFYTSNTECSAPQGKTHALDKAIVNKREELKRVLSALAATEYKMQSARECLNLIFGTFGRENVVPPSQYQGVQLELPSESMQSVRAFYEHRRERNARRVDVSMDIDASDTSLEVKDNSNPKFTDELRFYLEKFKLENNRQLVLESGEKLWIFETIDSSIRRFYSSVLSSEVGGVLTDFTGLSDYIRRVVASERTRLEVEQILTRLHGHIHIPAIDITPHKLEEQQKTDEIKKRLSQTIVELDKTTKRLSVAGDHLAYWSDNDVKKYISTARKHDGMTYRDYEAYYRESVMNCRPGYA